MTLLQQLSGAGIPLLPQEPMSRRTTFGIGGPALLIRPQNREQLQAAVAICRGAGQPPFILGRGSNLLVSDAGIARPVIQLGEGLSAVVRQGDTLRCGAGAALISVCLQAARAGLSGLEWAYGIPGSLGGGVYMNAGAYGGEMKDVVESVVVYYIPDQALTEVKGEDCGFAYRHSNFERVSCAIMGTVFRLTPDDPDAIAARMREMNEKRRNSQPLDMPSAGSAFKRPVGGYAAALIDQCGLKGYAVGGAQISEKHAGFAVNTGSATYDDVVALLDHVRREVYAKTEVTLEPEIRIYPKGMLLVDDWRLRKQSIMQQMQEAAQSRAAAEKEQGEVEPS